MNFKEIFSKRHAVRNYSSQPVEQAKLADILTAARLAPTAHNLQPQRLIIVQTGAGMTKLNKAANTYNAPLAIIIGVDTEQAWRRPNDGKSVADIDASIVTTYMMLQATELGLGSVWVGNFKVQILRQEFALAAQIEPMSILLIGYKADYKQTVTPKTQEIIINYY